MDWRPEDEMAQSEGGVMRAVVVISMAFSSIYAFCVCSNIFQTFLLLFQKWIDERVDYCMIFGYCCAWRCHRRIVCIASGPRGGRRHDDHNDFGQFFKNVTSHS